MSRVTITLSDERHRALKEAAARRKHVHRADHRRESRILRHQSLGECVGPRRRRPERSRLGDDDVMAVAVEETRIERFREDPKRVAQQQLDGLLLEGLDSGPAEPWTEADVDGIRSAVREALAKRRRAHGADTQGWAASASADRRLPAVLVRELERIA